MTVEIAWKRAEKGFKKDEKNLILVILVDWKSIV